MRNERLISSYAMGFDEQENGMVLSAEIPGVGSGKNMSLLYSKMIVDWEEQCDAYLSIYGDVSDKAEADM